MLESIVHEKSSNGRRIFRKDIDEKYRDKMVHFSPFPSNLFHSTV